MAKSKSEDVPDRTVEVQSVWNLEGFDPHANVPVVATWRDVMDVKDPAVAAEKPSKSAAAKKLEG
jgi:hypothetical protein